jgi:hypothetical protein
MRICAGITIGAHPNAALNAQRRLATIAQSAAA